MMRAMVLCGVKLLGNDVILRPTWRKQVEIDAGIAAARAFLGMADAGPSAVEPIGAVRPVGFAGREFLLEKGCGTRPAWLDLGAGEQPFVDEPPRIDFDHARMLGDARDTSRAG